MTTNYIVDPEQGQLSILYTKWRNNPTQYQKEMADTIDKIIYSTLARQSLQPIYWRIEDRDDLIQELRLLCFSKLQRISNPTNKRIFNFLRISIILGLKDMTRKVGKRMDRELREVEVLGEKTRETSIFYFNDGLLEKIATLLSNGESRQDICTKLQITRGRLNKEIEKLRNIYSDKK